MAAPVIRQFLGTIPDKGQAQTTFDTNVDAFLDWQALQFAPDLVAFGTFASDTAAALVAANLPPLTGRALDAVRVNAAANGVEFADVTAAGWALLDDANEAAQRATLGLVIGTNVSAIASPAFTGVPTAPTAAAATNTTQLATTAMVQAAITAGRAPDYVSAEFTPVSEDRRTLAHGLGVLPSRMHLVLRCNTSQFNFAVNDEVQFYPGAFDVNSVNGVQIACDATSLFYANSRLYVRNKTTGTGGAAWVEITYSNWRAKVVAWR